MLEAIRSVPAFEVVRVHRPDPDLLGLLAKYDREAFGETGLRTCDLAVMAEAGAVYLAYVGGEIAGGCQALRVMEEPDFVYLVGFYVRPYWRGRDLGKAFLLALAEELRAGGCEGMVLTVSPGNSRAVGLYQSVGFVTEASIPDFYGRGQDRHILRWRFEEGGLQGSV